MANQALTSAIDRINGTTAATSAATVKKGELGQEEFLRMLIAQLENQDPLNPQDATQFTAQLATFSSLEQLMSIKSGVDSLGKTTQERDAANIASLIDRTVLAKGSQVAFDGQQPVKLEFDLDRRSSTTEIDIKNRNGAVVRTLSVADLASGRHEVTWDGRTSNGTALQAGTYSFEVRGTSGGVDFAGTTYVEGRVTGTSLEGSTPALFLDSLVVPFSDVIEIRSQRTGS